MCFFTIRLGLNAKKTTNDWPFHHKSYKPNGQSLDQLKTFTS